MTKIKVAIIHNIIAPYRIPLFEALGQHELLDLTVYYCAETHKHRKWDIIQNNKFKHVLLPGITFGIKNMNYHINLSIIRYIFHERFDVIIIGGCSDFTTQMAFFFSKLYKKQIILWSEGIKSAESIPGKMIEPLTKLIIKRSDAIIVPGTNAKNYNLENRASENKIFIAPNVVDNEFYIHESSIFRNEKDDIKKDLGFEKKIILYLGRLVKQKGVGTLLLAFEKLHYNSSNVSLLIVGDGPDKEYFQDLCCKNDIADVYFCGWAEGKEKVKYYAIADVFVFPTLEDVWGLVVNEAMCCELPIISTSAAGCSKDMIVNGENGYVVKPDHSGELVDAIQKVIKNPSEPIRMGKKSLEIIQTKFTIDNAVNGFVNAIRYSLKKTF